MNFKSQLNFSFFSRKFFLSLVLFISSAFLMAQDFEGGMIFGVSGNQIDGDNYNGYAKFGLNLGAYVKRRISEKNAFQMEIKYEGKGASASFNFDPNAVDPPDQYRWGLHYIELPVTFIHQFHRLFAFSVGLQPGYLFLQRYRDDYGYTNTVENFNNYEIAGLAGLYYYYTERITVSLRLSYSLTPIYTTHGGVATYYSYRSSYNNGLGLCVFYRLGK